MRFVLSTAALLAAGALFAHTPRTAMACSQPVTAGRTDVEIVHDQKIIPKGAGILLRVTGSISPADPTAGISVGVKRDDGREISGVLTALEGGSGDQPNAYFQPDGGLAPGGYAVTVTVAASVYGQARSVTGWVRVADEAMRPPAVTFAPAVRSRVVVDDSHTVCCDAYEVGPLYGCGEIGARGAASLQIETSPAPRTVRHCFGDGLSARPRLEVTLQTGLSDVESSFLEHRFSALGAGGVLSEQVVRGGSSVGAAADWPAPQLEYCFRVETRSLVDGSVSTDLACAPHGSLALAAAPTDETKAEITNRMAMCLRAPEGHRDEWCAASEGNRSYCAWEDGGGDTRSGGHCSASGAGARARGLGFVAAFGALAIVAARRRRSSRR
jgi:hypothetical protein